MTDDEFKATVLRELAAVKQELKGFNGTPGLCKRVSNLEITVRRVIYSLCFIGGTGGVVAGISKVIGG